jgi:hypothetical protein
MECDVGGDLESVSMGIQEFSCQDSCKGTTLSFILDLKREMKVRRRAGEILDPSPQFFQIGTVALYAYHNKVRRFCFVKEGH